MMDKTANVTGDASGCTTSTCVITQPIKSDKEQASCEHCFHYSMTQFSMMGGHNEHCCHCGLDHWKFDAPVGTSGHGIYL